MINLPIKSFLCLTLLIPEIGLLFAKQVFGTPCTENESLSLLLMYTSQFYVLKSTPLSVLNRFFQKYELQPKVVHA